MGPFLRNPFLHFRVGIDALSFYRRIRSDIKSSSLESITTKEYFEKLMTLGYSKEFLCDIILPILATVNTCSFEDIYNMPAILNASYLAINSFSLTNKHRGLYRPIGGVEAIIKSLTANVKDIRLSTPISKIYRNSDQWVVQSENGKDSYDHVILATQANHALRIVENLDKDTANALGSITHARTKVLIHTDKRVMPESRSLWSPIHIVNTK